MRKFVYEGKLPHLLFYGPPGTGKTTTIMALAKEIYGPHYKNMVLELNASDDRGIDVVRNQIKSFASTMQIFNRGFKLIILDEADAMTSVAQNSLRRIIEKYTKNTRFCILANYAHKLNPALVSRCTRFRFLPILSSAIHERLKDVEAQEKLKIEPDAESALIQLSYGDMRKALNVLQACHASLDISLDSIDKEAIFECIGAPDPHDIDNVLNSVLQDDWTTSFLTVEKYKKQKGLALIDIIQSFVDKLNKLQLKPKTRIELLKGLCDIEYTISRGGNEKIHSSAMVGTIKSAIEFEK